MNKNIPISLYFKYKLVLFSSQCSLQKYLKNRQKNRFFAKIVLDIACFDQQMPNTRQ